MLFSLLSLRLLLVLLLLSSHRFHRGRYGSPLPVFRFGPIVSHSSLVSYVFRGVLILLCRLSVPCTRLICFFILRFRFPSFSAGSESLWRGGLLTLRRFSASSVILRRRSSECGFWCPVFSWSGKFPIKRCLWSWKSWSAVGVAMPVAVVLSCQGSATRSGPSSSLPRLGISMDVTSLGEAEVSPFWRTAGHSSVCAHSWCVVALGELQCFAGWWLPVPYLGASLFLQMLLIRLIKCTGWVCQYGVFMIKLILSYLPVHLISPTHPPLIRLP